jgi:hypothetical protein
MAGSDATSVGTTPARVKTLRMGFGRVVADDIERATETSGHFPPAFFHSRRIDRTLL